MSHLVCLSFRLLDCPSCLSVSACLSHCKYVCLPFCWSVWMCLTSRNRLSDFLSIYVRIYDSDRVFCLFASLSVRLCVCLCVFLLVSMLVGVSVSFSKRLCVSLCVRLLVCLSAWFYFRPFVWLCDRLSFCLCFYVFVYVLASSLVRKVRAEKDDWCVRSAASKCAVGIAVAFAVSSNSAESC